MRVRGLSALAVLRGEVPVLRLQQPRPPRRGGRGAVPRRLPGGDRPCRGACPRPGGHQHLPRRRHPFADAAGDGGGTARCGCGSVERRARRGGVAGANPSSVEAGRFRGYRDAGVNRVSLGVQALDDASLKTLGRLHNAEEAFAAIRIAQTTFARTSFDLIYARPGQSRPRGARRIAGGDRPRGGTSLALPAHHRAGHAVSTVSPPPAS